MNSVEHLAMQAREASRSFAALSSGTKNATLRDLADRLSAHRADILAANERDLRAASGLAPAKLKRLVLNDAGIDQMCDGVRQIADLPDPIGAVTKDRIVPSGLRVRKVRAPLGVICMIFEARPAVTIDAFALCFKAGNACILKGGKEAAQCAGVLAEIVRATLRDHALPQAGITSISDTGRDDLKLLLQQDSSIDLVIPRGGTELISFVKQHSKIPTIQHYQGVCHIYVDMTADLAMVQRVCVTAKVGAPAACNAAECVLVHRDIAPACVPSLVAAFQASGVEVRGDAEIRRLAQTVVPAADSDFGKEFLDLVVAMKVVPSLDDAIEHIQRYGSSHTEAILTRDTARAEEFCRRVQSSCVVVNASTRFNDGYQLGLGAEIGISTSRLHAYGPMGLEELTIERFVVDGDGQVR
jgi:glutamate-5-semialdehyde dehydrogenase